MIDTDWMDEAACVGEEQLFFPVSYIPDRIQTIKELCASCPVQRECERYGAALLKVRIPITRGFWGGFSVEELRRRQKMPAKARQR